MFFIIFFIGVLYLILKNKTKEENNGQISGVVYSKYNQKSLKNVKISLGRVQTNGIKQNFTIENNLTTKTNEAGEYKFSDIKIKTYWIMAEFEGKKVLKMLRLSKEIPEIEDVFLKF